MTAEEWESAMAAFKIGDNFSWKASIVLEAMYGQLSMGEVTAKHDGLNWHCKLVDIDYEAYYKLTEDQNAGGGYSCQMIQTGGYPDGQWIEAAVPWGMSVEDMENESKKLAIFNKEAAFRVEIFWGEYYNFDLFRSIKMDGFTYNEEKDCYVHSGSATFGTLTSEEDEEYRLNSGAEVQFKNGKVVRISFVYDLLSGGEIYKVPWEITFFDYGTTTVTFPSEP